MQMAWPVSQRINAAVRTFAVIVHTTHMCELSDAIALRLRHPGTAYPHLPSAHPGTVHFDGPPLDDVMCCTYAAQPGCVCVNGIRVTVGGRRLVLVLVLVACECWFVSSLKTRFVSKYMSVGWSSSSRPFALLFSDRAVFAHVWTHVHVVRHTTRRSMAS